MKTRIIFAFISTLITILTSEIQYSSTYINQKPTIRKQTKEVQMSKTQINDGKITTRKHKLSAFDKKTSLKKSKICKLTLCEGEQQADNYVYFGEDYTEKIIDEYAKICSTIIEESLNVSNPIKESNVDENQLKSFKSSEEITELDGFNFI